ncbi:hypothetical protein GYMLUDRAFT_232565 [Collybiopsis luxurians FD-317 M1]|uniref:Uncharacterized protein n=1 Tax=Collybiopsis luxurians FD-317 M1 TaxID=944289 RepID=A0A0D0BGJ4_9AGAR|nr:hypothetical protein GYMLUDRAFT_232565 [Collybiopsis luxurians FD-317 M1]
MLFSFYDQLGSPQPFDTKRSYVTSPWFSPAILAAIRGTIAVYTFITLLVILIYDSVVTHDGNSYFSYFTELTYIGICSYYWASFTQTFVYAIRLRRAPNKAPEYPLQRWPRILQLLHVMLGTTVVSFPILVTIVFWALLASPSVFATPFSAWSNISIHALNTAWSLFEMVGTNSPPPRWLMIPLIIIILALYLGLAYITYATQGFYTYSFLDPSEGKAHLAGYIIGIAVAGCIVFTLAKTIMWTRAKVAPSKGIEVEGEEEEEKMTTKRVDSLGSSETAVEKVKGDRMV